jgi:hypothetical protein
MIHNVAHDIGGISKSSHANRGSPPAMPTVATSTESAASIFSCSVSGAIGPFVICVASTFAGSSD